VPSPLLDRATTAGCGMIAALYVDPAGCYAGIDGVDLWDEARDARRYGGAWPVVAHPPCQRWCKMAPVNQARYGISIGSDDGCFSFALAAVRRWGGVLEHPAYSLAWAGHGLPWPPETGGWQQDIEGGWCCYVEQGNYGHRARKPTWLYAVGTKLPALNWQKARRPAAWISADRPRAVLNAMGIAQLGKREASATPPAFRDVLLAIARGAAA
jgi:hypothetical protein